MKCQTLKKKKKKIIIKIYIYYKINKKKNIKE